MIATFDGAAGVIVVALAWLFAFVGGVAVVAGCFGAEVVVGLGLVVVVGVVFAELDGYAAKSCVV